MFAIKSMATTNIFDNATYQPNKLKNSKLSCILLNILLRKLNFLNDSYKYEDCHYAVTNSILS